MLKTDVTIKDGGYVASFRSDLGGNCYRLFHEASGAEILRTPKDEAELFEEIFLFGNAILFPPNRIRGGKFTFEGREYAFPVNEAATGCHLHGALYKKPFAITKQTKNAVTFTFQAKAGEYLSFPHAFTIKRSYTLDENGLSECVETYNDSEENMPFMLAFHTTLNVPFLQGADGGDCTLTLPVAREQVRDERYLPTLAYVGGRARENALCKGEYRITENAVSSLYESTGNVATITDGTNKWQVGYEASEAYKYRMLWRRENAAFVVVEPQTCAIDCFHLETSPSEKGLLIIPPHKSLRLYTRFFAQSIK